MWFSWLRKFLRKPSKGHGHRPRSLRYHLSLDYLEDRVVPAMFLSPVNYTAGTAPGIMTSGDFNGDGKLDLIAANSAAQTVSVLLGNGDGTLAPGQIFSTGAGAAAGAGADFNGTVCRMS
jgi:hypothetical protein